jgi:hypothetical protein
VSVVSKSLVATLTSSAVGVGGLRIEAWDAAGICTDLIDVALSDVRGHFEMQLDSDYLSELLPQKVPQISFRIFDNGKPVSQWHQIVWQLAHELAELQSSLATTGDPNIVRAIPAGAVVRGSSSKGCGMPAPARGCRSLHALKPRRRYGELVAEPVRVPRGL